MAKLNSNMQTLCIRAAPDRDPEALDFRFWMETVALSAVFGAILAGVIRMTGRPVDVVMVAAAIGLMKLLSVMTEQPARQD